MSDYKNNPVTKPAPPKGAGSGSRSKVGLIIAGVVVAVVVVVGLVVLLTGGKDNGGSAKSGTGAQAAANSKQETAQVEVSGEDLPSIPDVGQPIVPTDKDQGVGLVPPKLSGETFDGSKVVIDPSDGEAKLVMFVAHWCPHCQKEVPLVHQWIDEGKVPKGVKVYSVATGTDNTKNNYPPSNWLKSVGWQPQVLLDDSAQDAFLSWGGTGYPYFVLVGADGKVVQRGSGEITVDQFTSLVNQVAGSSSSGSGSSTSTTATSG